MPRKTFVAGDVLQASEVNSFLMNQAVMTFATAAARNTAITLPLDGMVTYLEDSKTYETYNGAAWVPFTDITRTSGVSLTTPSAGQKLVFNGTDWVNLTGYVYVDTVYFTSSGTFTKATYPWLRAIRVRLVGGGGGGRGPAAGVSAGGGGAGGYAEAFISDIAGLDASVTVTRGAGGTGGAAGGNNGNNGGSSSAFGLTAGGGGFGSNTGGDGGTASGGDLNAQGGPGHSRIETAVPLSGNGGDSILSGGGNGGRGASAPGAAGQLGSGGGGGRDNNVGGAGGNGIVIVDLFA